LGDHSDLDRLNRLYALQLVRQPLPTSEQVAERLRPTHSPAFLGSSPPSRPDQAWARDGSRVAAGSDDPPYPLDLDPEQRYICARCRSPIRRNPTLRISFCEVCGLTQGFIELRHGKRSRPLYVLHPFPGPTPPAPALRPVPSRPGSGPIVRPSRPPVSAPSCPAPNLPLRQNSRGEPRQPGLNLVRPTRVSTRVHAEGGL